MAQMTEIQAKVKVLEGSVTQPQAQQRVKTSDGHQIAQNLSESNTFERDTQEIVLPESLNQTNLEVGQLKEELLTLKAQMASFAKSNHSVKSVQNDDEEDNETEFEQYKMKLTKIETQVRTIKSAMEKEMDKKIEVALGLKK